MISAIILIGGKMDKDLLKKCLDSVSWCDEIIKVETEKIDGGFAEWRNEGARKANGEWILYIDSDEEVSEDLRVEIEKEIDKATNTAYAISRRNFIFGKEFKHGGEFPDYQIRLFLKNKFKNWTGDLHEKSNFEGSLGYLKNSLIHHKNLTLSDMVEKTNIWSEIEAKLMFEAKHPQMNFFRFCSAGFREFWKRMIVQMAFLDGKEGVIYALYQVFSRLISYSKLWELQLQGKTSTKRYNNYYTVRHSCYTCSTCNTCNTYTYARGNL